MKKTIIIQAVAVCLSVTLNTKYANAQCLANFSFSTTSLTVSFTDMSTTTNPPVMSWNWNFGDGFTGSVPNPSHTYSTSGTYNVCLTITDSSGCNDSICQTLTVSGGGGCTANFSFSTTSLTASFTDMSTSSNPPITSWYWNFGDGFTDNVPNPIHTYSTGGTYNVCLTITDSSGCNDSICQTLTVSGGGGCMANFSFFTDTSLTVSFTDSSTTSNPQPITSWNWNFGDSTTSSIQNPSHTYISSGTYNVCLTITDGTGCSNTICKTVTVSGGTPPHCTNGIMDYDETGIDCGGIDCGPCGGGCTANFSFSTTSLTVSFTDMSTTTNPPVMSWNWNFGDGFTGSVPNPSHTYSTSGTYNVCLTITDSSGCNDSICQTLTVSGGGGCTANFSFSTTSLTASFTDMSTSSNPPLSWSWDFGDANCSPYPACNQDNSSFPSHTYSSSGTYNVCLTITDSSGCTDSICQVVTVSGGTPPHCTNSIMDFDETGIDCGGIDCVPCGGSCTANFTSTAPVCKGSGVDFTDLSTSSGSIISWSWNFGSGANPATSTLMNPAGIVYSTGGTKTVTLIISDGACTDTSIKTITIYSSPATVITGTNVSCSGNCDGAASLTVSNGTPPYGYSWSNGANTEDLTNLCADTYTVTVTDSNGCTSTGSVTVSSSNTLTAVITGTTPASCLAICDGIASGFATGGTQPYTYLWNDPLAQTNSIANNLCAGSYVVMVTDASGCQDTAGVIVNSSPEMLLNITKTDATCGNADGNASVAVTNGTSPYTYSWTSGDTLATADSLTSGIYVVTVTDDNGCSGFKIATISDANGPVINIITTTNVTCNGGSDGVIGVSITGGVAPYTYQWSNGGTSNFIFGLVAGPHELTVTDSTGCVANASITLTEPAPLILTVTTTEANCSNADGSASLTVNGGTPPYTYLWSSGGTAATETGLAAGIYTVTVTDAAGCSDSANAAVSNIGGASITIDSIIDGGCGVALGSVYISVSGGAAPYNYLWSDNSTAEDLINVPAGSYNVQVTDTNGCIATASIIISGVPASVQQICLVTVDSATGRNIIVWEKSQVQGVQSYNIYKESTQAGVYYLVGNVPVDSLSQFIDTLSNPLQQAWRYKISVVDSCGNESELSAAHKTMHLTINEGLGNINLIWDHYQGFSFLTYYIYRYTSSTGWEEIDSIASNLTSRTDFSPPSGNLWYRVEVKHPSGCSPSKKAENYNSSKSNTSTAVTTGINNQSSIINNQLTVYPNPSRGVFTIECQMSDVKPVVSGAEPCQMLEVRVYDVLGREVYKPQVPSSKSQVPRGEFEIDISGQPAGVYHLQVLTDNTIVNRKIVVE